MASNFFGQVFRITTFGESHGKGIGVVIDGCPSGISISEEEINLELSLRKSARNSYTSPRKENDLAEILSGVFEGKTTGAPLTLFIRNVDAQSSQYESIKDLYRPGHANFTYLHKYGVFDYRGGGRASARETAARVAAGAVAKKILSLFDIKCVSFITQIGETIIDFPKEPDLDLLKQKTHLSPIFCPDEKGSQKMVEAIEEIKKEKDSLGGIVGTVCQIPIGLGEPIYLKLEALLAFAMLSIPASKGFEIGSGFKAASMRGSVHNDPFDLDLEGKVHLRTNFGGGTLGGISTGALLSFNVAFKPTSSIQRPIDTVDLNHKKRTFELSKDARHDPCVAIRAVPVVEAMTALVLVDALLMSNAFLSCKKETALPQ